MPSHKCEIYHIQEKNHTRVKNGDMFRAKSGLGNKLSQQVQDAGSAINPVTSG